MNKIIAAFFFLLAMAVSATAGEKRTGGFDGFYLGAIGARTNLSGAWKLQPTWGEYVSRKSVSRSFPVNLSTDGWQGGIVAGYNWDVGRPGAWVVGMEVDVLFGGIDASNALPQKKGRYVFDRGVDSMSISNQFTVRGRVGYDVKGFMPYIAAGAACAEVSTSSAHWMYANQNSSGTQCGPTVGIGAEMMLGKNNGWSGRIEYRQTDYGLVETRQTIFGIVKHF